MAKQYHLSADEQYRYASIMNASALLLYPDPQHYNPNHEAPFPQTPFLPGDGVRSESVFWNGAGDPETVGLPSNEYAYRDAEEFKEQLTLPALSISGDAAYQVFQKLKGIVAPDEWRGGFNLTYRVGPGLINNLKVRVVVNSELENRTIHNVVATLKGNEEPDRYVIVGSQRDSLSHGAVDSISGHAVFLELAKVLGKMVHIGWKPRRSIVFCSWGAEEYNLAGSTEWVEDNLKLLQARAVAYININQVVLGNETLSVTASPMLYQIVFNATKEVSLPSVHEDQRKEDMNSVYDRWLVSTPIMRNQSTMVVTPTLLKELTPQQDTDKLMYKDRHHFRHEEPSEPGTILQTYLESSLQQIRPLIRRPGMHSSFTSFMTIAGIPFVDLGFVSMFHLDDKNWHDKEDSAKSFPVQPYVLLHTQYDTLESIEEFVDPEFLHHRLAGQLYGQIIQELTDTVFLPFNLLHYCQLLKDFQVKTQQLYNAIVLNDQSISDSMFLDLSKYFRGQVSKVKFALFSEYLNQAIQSLTEKSILFHEQQDKVDTSE